MAKNKKNAFNIYEFMNKKKKSMVLGICLLLVLTMVVGIFAQFALM